MSIRVQSPEISNQLRERLALDGAGSFGMHMEQTIQPIAIVADVREELNDQLVTVASWVDIAAVAGEVAVATIDWFQVIPAQNVARILIDRMILASNVAHRILYGMNPPGAPIGLNQSALPQRKLGSAWNELVSGRVMHDTQVGALNPAQAMGSVSLGANTAIQVDFHEPITLDIIGQWFAVVSGTANAELRVSFEWRELRRG